MKIANDEYEDNIDARFFIAQPKSEEEYLPAVLQVNQEASTFQDIIVMPGPVSFIQCKWDSLSFTTPTCQN